MSKFVFDLVKGNFFKSFSSFLAFTQSNENFLFQAQPLKILNKKCCLPSNSNDQN